MTDELKQVAWRYRHVPTVSWSYSETRHPRDDLEQEPIYPASAIAALMADNERLRELEDDAKQLKRLFDQQWKRTREAGDLWRQAHPGNDNVSPDLGELVKWLMDRATAAEARLAEAVKVMEPFAFLKATIAFDRLDEDNIATVAVAGAGSARISFFVRDIIAARAFIEKEKSNG